MGNIIRGFVKGSPCLELKDCVISGSLRGSGTLTNCIIPKECSIELPHLTVENSIAVALTDFIIKHGYRPELWYYGRLSYFAGRYYYSSNLTTFNSKSIAGLSCHAGPFWDQTGLSSILDWLSCWEEDVFPLLILKC